VRRYAIGRRRHKPGQMNKLEQKYADDLLLSQKSGGIEWFSFEAIKLKLADKTFYTPDFFVMRPNGELECHEVKGFWEDDARVKIKCAAEKFPFQFFAITLKRGEWQVEQI
jgi:hypothetical protein